MRKGVKNIFNTIEISRNEWDIEMPVTMDTTE